MESMKKIGVCILATALTVSTLCACGTKDKPGKTKDEPNPSVSAGNADGAGKVNENYFEWRDNTIIGVTDEGSKETSVIIPARCEGFSGVIFQDTDITEITFEDDDDVALDVAFMGASQLASVRLPANLTVIPSMCFEGCEGLISMTIPASVTTLEEYAFKYCSALESLVFQGNQLSVIGGHSFENCSALKTLDIPDGVTTIGQYAFADCGALETITLSESVNKIEKFAFSNIAAKSISLPEGIRVETMDTSAFGMNTYVMVVYVVEGSWSDQNREIWDVGFNEIRYQ